MAINQTLGELIVKLKAEGAGQTLADMEFVSEAFEDLAEVSGNSTDDMDKDLEKWGLAFKSIGASATGVISALIISGPVAQRNLKEIRNLFGEMGDLLFMGLGLDVFLSGAMEGMAQFIQLWSEGGLLGAIWDVIDTLGIFEGGLLGPFSAIGEELTGLPLTFETLKTNLLNIGGSIKTKLGEIWDSIKTSASTKWTDIKTTLTTKAQAVRDGVVNWFGVSDFSLWKKLGGIWSSIKLAASTAWTTIKTTLSSIASDIVKAVKEKMEQIIGFVTRAIEALRRLARAEGGGGAGFEASEAIPGAPRPAPGPIATPGPTSGTIINRTGGTPIEIVNRIILDDKVVATSTNRINSTQIRRLGA